MVAAELPFADAHSDGLRKNVFGGEARFFEDVVELVADNPALVILPFAEHLSWLKLRAAVFKALGVAGDPAFEELDAFFVFVGLFERDKARKHIVNRQGVRKTGGVFYMATVISG